jgi:hypothetical protein
MSEERWVKESPTPGEDPREIDRERKSDDILDEMTGQDGIVHPQPPKHGLGTTSDAPGQDLDDLAEAGARDVPEYRDQP